MKIIIKVEGGRVECVHAKAQDEIECLVFDFDCPESSDDAEDMEATYEESISDCEIIY